MPAVPGCGALSPRPSAAGHLRTVCPFAGLAVNLLFQSTDLQRSCRDRWFLASMDHGSEHGSGYFSVFEGGQVWLLYVSVITSFNAFFMKREICFRNKGTRCLRHLFPMHF